MNKGSWQTKKLKKLLLIKNNYLFNPLDNMTQDEVNSFYGSLMTLLEKNFYFHLINQVGYQFDNDLDRRAFDLYLKISNSRNFNERIGGEE